MNLAIIGYGKMGHLVEQLAPEYGFAVPVRIGYCRKCQRQGITRERFRGIDVAVEFSTPSAVLTDIERLPSDRGQRRGWHDGLDRTNGARKSGRRKRRHRIGLESQLLHRR